MRLEQPLGHNLSVLGYRFKMHGAAGGGPVPGAAHFLSDSGMMDANFAEPGDANANACPAIPAGDSDDPKLRTSAASKVVFLTSNLWKDYCSTSRVHLKVLQNIVVPLPSPPFVFICGLSTLGALPEHPFY